MITATILAIPTYICFLWFIRQLETMRQQLTDNVRHDDLTGLLARDAFLEEFTARHENQTKRVDQAFLIIDADYFKRINDNYGHHVGDRALLAITRALKSGIRETDRIGRLGGEEFAIHLKDVSASTALEIAERLRKNVEEASADLEILEFELTVSIGGIFYNTKQDVLSLITAADRQLYRAKDNGRNRVEFETQMELSTA
ncbi:MAG: GGDEF domain-containing protein [Pseudomonadota bacterium]